MTKSEELKQIEIEKLNDEISDIAELEKLILDGAGAKIPYIIDYPFYNENTQEIIYKKMAIKLSPLTSTEWNNAMGNGYDRNSTIRIVTKALYTKNEEPFPKALVEKMPNGVINTLFKEIAKISGVEFDTESTKQIVKDLMGF